MMKLLLATHNRGKVKDLQVLLADSGITVLSLDDVPPFPEVEEDGETFLDNARKKAWACQKATGLTCLADDSGLEVEILNNAPGVRSARYGGEPSDDRRNVNRLQKELEDYPSPKQRDAHFVCVLVLACNDGREFVTEGYCHGTIAMEPSGDNGFGYDPVFLHPSHGGLTMGEVSREEKNRVSHRGAALRSMKPILLSLASDMDES